MRSPGNERLLPSSIKTPLGYCTFIRKKTHLRQPKQHISVIGVSSPPKIQNPLTSSPNNFLTLAVGPRDWHPAQPRFPRVPWASPAATLDKILGLSTEFVTYCQHKTEKFF